MARAPASGEAKPGRHLPGRGRAAAREGTQVRTTGQVVRGRPGSTAIPDSIETSTRGKAMSANRNSTPMTTPLTEHDQPPTPDRRPTPSPLKGVRPVSEFQPSSDRDRIVA